MPTKTKDIRKTITTTFDQLEKEGHSSVTDYCRWLMKLNAERYENMAVEVYRGEMLCLITSSVKEGAEIEPNGTGWRKYVPRKIRRHLGARMEPVEAFSDSARYPPSLDRVKLISEALGGLRELLPKLTDKTQIRKVNSEIKYHNKMLKEAKGEETWKNG